MAPFPPEREDKPRQRLCQNALIARKYYRTLREAGALQGAHREERKPLVFLFLGVVLLFLWAFPLFGQMDVNFLDGEHFLPLL